MARGTPRYLISQPRLRIAPTPFDFLLSRPGASVAAKKSTTKWPRRDFPRYVRRENAHIRSLRHVEAKTPANSWAKATAPNLLWNQGINWLVNAARIEPVSTLKIPW